MSLEACRLVSGLWMAPASGGKNALESSAMNICVINWALCIVIFVASAAEKRIACADIGSPAALGNSAICDRSELKKAIDEEKWIGADIPPLKIGGVEARSCFIGDCAFSLGASTMKAASEAEVNATPDLNSSSASQALKPVERAFSIFKSRFLALKQGLKLHHEDDEYFFCKARSICLTI